MEKHKVFLIVSESAGGKDSLVNKLCEELGLKQLISYATRPRREGEGETHIFISEDDVKYYTNDMIAYTRIGEFSYFSTIKQLYESDVYVIDPNGTDYMKLISKYKGIDDIDFVVIYINTPAELRAERALNQRHDDFETYYKRVLNEQEQFTSFKACAKFDYAVLNKDFNKAYNVLKHIIEVETTQN